MSKVYIGIDKSKSYRVYLTIATDMVEEARRLHNASPLATAGLGRTLIGAGLMGLFLKGESNKLTVQFKGEGPAKQILATADGAGNVKGYIANPDVDLPLTKYGKLDVGGSLGLGQLTVIKDLGMKEPYVGTIDLVSGEIADDLTAYFFISEQQNSSVALGVKIGRDLTVETAGGMIIQMLPGAEEASIDALEVMLDGLKPLTTVIGETEAAFDEKSIPACRDRETALLEALVDSIFGSMPEDYRPELLDFREMKWKCDCSKENMARALTSIGAEDLKEIIEEDGQAELTCQFCEKSYKFNKEELEEILKWATRK